jgi:hypothetical protein
LYRYTAARLELREFGREALKAWSRRCGEKKAYVANLRRTYKVCVRGRARRWLRAWMAAGMRGRSDRTRIAEGRLMRGVAHFEVMHVLYMFRAWKWHVFGARRVKRWAGLVNVECVRRVLYAWGREAGRRRRRAAAHKRVATKRAFRGEAVQVECS